jgi:hypothetical protein
MLAAARDIRANGRSIGKSPLLVPSFSSKGFNQVSGIIDAMSETITEGILVSAYDVAKKIVKEIPTFPEFIILDSGGYECSKDTDISDQNMNTYREIPWTIDELKSVLDGWQATQPTLAVSYDHPKARCSLAEQIERAKDLFKGRTFGRELLIKPSSNGADFVHIKEVKAELQNLGDFDVIGFTEKELGSCIFDRMKTIKRIRESLTAEGLDTPIHVFGSLDPISTPLYFFSGADIFDGLTWLRYGYVDGQAVYGHNAGLIKYGPRVSDMGIWHRLWAENYQEIINLEFRLKRYLTEDRNLAHFDARSRRLFEDTVQELMTVR